MGDAAIDLYRPSRDVALLYPPFRERLEAGLKAATDQGIQAFVFEAFRLSARQSYLWAKGRTAPGPVVTNAPAELSWHEYGLAVDVVFDGGPQAGIQWSWDGDYVGEKKGDYQHLGAVLMAHGLEWYGAPGARFHELPHFQMTWGLKIEQARDLKRKGGIKAVFAELDRRRQGG